jgi:Domain of unknown function (DUF4261)
MSLAVAMVALPRVGPLPALSDLNGWLAGHAQSMPPLIAAQSSDEALAATTGDAELMIGLMTAPMPWSELEGPCASAFWWPEAASVLKAHVGHLILALQGGEMDAIGRNLQLTSVVAAVLATGDASGVYWGAGTLVIPPALFVEAARSMTRELLPLDLWIDFRVSRDEDGAISLFTTGLEDLGHMEIEISRWNVEPGTARESAWNVAHYLLDQGPVLDDGDSIGFGSDEQIRIRHLPSMWNPARTVIRLEL